MIELAFRHALHQLAWNTNHGGMVRHGMYDYGTSSNLDVISDSDISQHGRARADNDTVADRGMSFTRFITGAAQRHVLIEQHVISDLGRLTNHHAHPVVDEEPFADNGTGVNFDAGETP